MTDTDNYCGINFRAIRISGNHSCRCNTRFLRNGQLYGLHPQGGDGRDTILADGDNARGIEALAMLIT